MGARGQVGTRGGRGCEWGGCEKVGGHERDGAGMGWRARVQGREDVRGTAWVQQGGGGARVRMGVARGSVREGR